MITIHTMGFAYFLCHKSVTPVKLAINIFFILHHSLPVIHSATLLYTLIRIMLISHVREQIYLDFRKQKMHIFHSIDSGRVFKWKNITFWRAISIKTSHKETIFSDYVFLPLTHVHCNTKIGGCTVINHTMHI